jgi:hypothetical protein
MMVQSECERVVVRKATIGGSTPKKKAAPTAKVFVVPELMAGDPVEEGGFLEEHLEVGRKHVTSSVRERIEAYLRDPGVSRKPPATEWPSAGELAKRSSFERQQWQTWEAQHWVDSSLRKLLSGKTPREVFKLGAKKRERPTSAARDRNICAEVLRLMERGGYSRAEAMERVAAAFSVSLQVVERAGELWGWNARAKQERRRFVPLWEDKLRFAGKLR